MSDIISVTKEVMALFEKHDLTRAQSMFVAEAIKMQLTEDMVNDMIKDKIPEKISPQAGIY